MAKFDPKPTLNPWTDRHQIWNTWLRRGMVWFSGTAYLTAGFKFTTGWPLLPWQGNLGQNWRYLGLYIPESFQGRAIQWCQTNSTTVPRPTPVAMATKF